MRGAWGSSQRRVRTARRACQDSTQYHSQSSGIRRVFLITGVGDDPVIRLSPETGIYRLR